MERSDLRTTYSRATELYRQKRYEEALALLRDLNEAFPGEPALLYSCALCLASLGRSMEAIGLCDRLIREHHDVRGVELRARIAAILADAEERQPDGGDAQPESELPADATALGLSAEDSSAPGTEPSPPAEPAEPDADPAAAPPEPDQESTLSEPDAVGSDRPSYAADDLELMPDAANAVEPSPEPEAAVTPRRRRSRLAAAVVLLVLLAGGGAAAYIWWPRLDPPKTPPPEGPMETVGDVPAQWVFPAGRIFGDLAHRPAGSAGPWESLGPARDRVPVPPGAQLRLTVRDYHWLDAAVFEQPASGAVATLRFEARALGDTFALQLPPLPGVETLEVARAIALTDAGFRALVAACAPVSVSLSGVPLLTPQSLEWLATQPQLTAIDLAETHFSGTAVAPLAALEELRILHLPAGVTGEGLSAFANHDALRALSLGAIADADSLALLSDLPRLASLTLRGGATLDGLAAVSELPALASLAIDGPLVDGDLRPLDRAAGLKELTLRGTEVSTASAPTLAELRSLEDFAAELPPGAASGPDVARAVAVLPALHTVALRGPAFGDDAVRELAALTSLRRLDLTGTRTTAQGLEALRALPALETLTLDRSGVTGVAASVLASFPALREVSAVHTGLDDSALARLREEHPDLRLVTEPALAVRYVSFPVSEEVGRLYTSEEALGDGPRRLVGRASGDVPVPRTLDAVLVLDTAAAVEALPLAALQPGALQGVSLRDEAASPAALAGVAGLSALERLQLDGSRVTDELLASFPSMPALERLDLANSAVTAAGVRHIVAAVPGLLHLSLRGSAGIDAAALRPLAALHRLKTLDLRETAVTDGALARLHPLLALDVIHLEGTAVTQQGVAALQAALPESVIITDVRAFDTLPDEPEATPAP